MIVYLFILTSLLFFVWIIRSILFWVYLFQLKEYRFDRVFVHLLETHQGRELLFSKRSLMKWLALFSYILLALLGSYLVLFDVLVFLIFAYEAFIVFQEIKLRLIRRPIITVKGMFIVISSFLILLLFFLIPLVDQFAWLLLLDRFIPFLIAIFVFGLSFPTDLYRDYVIERARDKIEKRQDSSNAKVLVIGITGSYGKSSTKEYIAQILSKKFKVLKTKGTNNTPIGVANTVLSGLDKNIQIFVVEMGAYKKGEIQEICDIVHPRIGILTGVSNQHLSLFGNLKNLIETKYELIDSLPKDGLAMFNSNNPNTYFLYKKTKKRKVLYKSLINNTASCKDQSRKNPSDILAYHVVIEKKSISFNVKLNKKEICFSAPLIGAHNIEDVLPGIYIANYLGMSSLEIQSAVSSLVSFPKTMVLHEMKNGTVVIDDTFNASPAAVMAALGYMNVFNSLPKAKKGKTILIMEPMIELGNNAKEQHYLLGKEISSVCDFLFLTNNNYFDSVEKGIQEGKGRCVVQVSRPLEILQFIRSTVTKNDIIVFEGRQANLILSKIL